MRRSEGCSVRRGNSRVGAWPEPRILGPFVPRAVQGGMRRCAAPPNAQLLVSWYLLLEKTAQKRGERPAAA